MGKWLPIAMILPFGAATVAHAQMRGLAPPEVAGVARSHAVDLRLRQDRGFEGPAPLVDGMIAQQGVADNAYLGLGLARMYSRQKGGNARITDQPVMSRKPAVTFVMKF